MPQLKITQQLGMDSPTSVPSSARTGSSMASAHKTNRPTSRQRQKLQSQSRSHSIVASTPPKDQILKQSRQTHNPYDGPFDNGEEEAGVIAREQSIPATPMANKRRPSGAADMRKASSQKGANAGTETTRVKPEAPATPTMNRSQSRPSAMISLDSDCSDSQSSDSVEEVSPIAAKAKSRLPALASRSSNMAKPVALKKRALSVPPRYARSKPSSSAVTSPVMDSVEPPDFQLHRSLQASGVSASSSAALSKRLKLVSIKPSVIKSIEDVDSDSDCFIESVQRTPRRKKPSSAIKKPQSTTKLPPAVRIDDSENEPADCDSDCVLISSSTPQKRPRSAAPDPRDTCKRVKSEDRPRAGRLLASSISSPKEMQPHKSESKSSRPPFTPQAQKPKTLIKNVTLVDLTQRTLDEETKSASETGEINVSKKIEAAGKATPTKPKTTVAKHGYLTPGSNASATPGAGRSLPTPWTAKNAKSKEETAAVDPQAQDSRQPQPPAAQITSIVGDEESDTDSVDILSSPPPSAQKDQELLDDTDETLESSSLPDLSADDRPLPFPVYGMPRIASGGHEPSSPTLRGGRYQLNGAYHGDDIQRLDVQGHSGKYKPHHRDHLVGLKGILKPLQAASEIHEMASRADGPVSNLSDKLAKERGKPNPSLVDVPKLALSKSPEAVPAKAHKTKHTRRNIKAQFVRDGVAEHAIKPTVARLAKRIASGEDFDHLKTGEAYTASQLPPRPRTERGRLAMKAELHHRGIHTAGQLSNFWNNLMVEYSRLAGFEVPLMSLLKKAHDDFLEECLEIGRDLKRNQQKAQPYSKTVPVTVKSLLAESSDEEISNEESDGDASSEEDIGMGELLARVHGQRQGKPAPGPTVSTGKQAVPPRTCPSTSNKDAVQPVHEVDCVREASPSAASDISATPSTQLKDEQEDYLLREKPAAVRVIKKEQTEEGEEEDASSSEEELQPRATLAPARNHSKGLKRPRSPEAVTEVLSRRREQSTPAKRIKTERGTTPVRRSVTPTPKKWTRQVSKDLQETPREGQSVRLSRFYAQCHKKLRKREMTDRV